ncbi:hypothetical protein [Lacipirellula parvula]|uniref:Uncharacterized protein n=1 Tax=Lacipirellula parvula TaxID=2650471 RepID=A0A5K7XGY9_9BACT|nr:hypothetical protein [Lacipirellula parvula]BBO35708.1 hypothetical protein PLANPX_5320 [Lacipirellula parvula]
MSSSPIFLDLYGIWDGSRSLTISQSPCIARLSFDFEGAGRELTIVNPSSYLEVANFLDGECCRIAVFNRNAEDGNFLEFGRFRVEFHTEDNLLTQFEADAVTFEDRV